MTASIIVSASAEPADREIIASGIRAFNESRAGPIEASALAVLLKNDTGETVGGLWGRTSFGWLFVELLFVPEALRGQGHGLGLLQAAEGAAKARNCHSVWLDTFDFQAVGFYERLGYRQFGLLEKYPREHTRRFFCKSL